MTHSSATVIYVAYRTRHIDLSWIPDEAQVIIVHNDKLLLDRDVKRGNAFHLHNDRNEGFGKGVNGALPLVTTNRIILCNPDTRLMPEHWRVLTEAGDEEVVTVPLVDAHGLRTSVVNMYPSALVMALTAWKIGRIMPRASRLRKIGTPILGVWGRSHVRAMRNDGLTRSLSQYWASAAVLSVATERLLEVGGFDPRYFMYFEDVDLSRRLAMRYPQMTVRSAIAVPGLHSVAGSTSSNQRMETDTHHARSALRFAQSMPGTRWRITRSLVEMRLSYLEFRTARIRSGKHGGAHAVESAKRNIVDVVIVSSGRITARGEMRRVRSWRDLFASAGLSVEEIRANTEAHPRYWIPGFRDIKSVIRGRAVPESLAWNSRTVVRRLESAAPRIVIVVTARSYSPQFVAGPWSLILDLVDSLSANYRARAVIAASSAEKAFLILLSWCMGRFEARLPTGISRTVAAGWMDATSLRVEWVPTLVEVPVRQGFEGQMSLEAGTEGLTDREFDLVFMGTLSYSPNAEALQLLGRMWREIVARRPGTTLLVAGSRPPPSIVRLCNTYGWTLQADFDTSDEVLRRGRVALAPLITATGFQQKILDAASAGLPQVATPTAIQGFKGGFPVTIAEIGPQFVDAILNLLDNRCAQEEQRAKVLSELTSHYTVQSWRWWVDSLL